MEWCYTSYRPEKWSTDVFSASENGDSGTSYVQPGKIIGFWPEFHYFWRFTYVWGVKTHVLDHPRQFATLVWVGRVRGQAHSGAFKYFFLDTKVFVLDISVLPVYVTCVSVRVTFNVSSYFSKYPRPPGTVLYLIPPRKMFFGYLFWSPESTVSTKFENWAFQSFKLHVRAADLF